MAARVGRGRHGAQLLNRSGLSSEGEGDILELEIEVVGCTAQ